MEKSQHRDLESILQWIIAYQEKEIVTEEQIAKESLQQQQEQLNANELACSIICNDCGKVFESLDDANLHSFKTRHDSFTESITKHRPLTETELQEKKEQLKIKLSNRRKEREALDREEALRNEQIRRSSGKKLLQSSQENEEKEMQKMFDQRKNEKLEDTLAKQKILAQIEADKQERRERIASAEIHQAPTGVSFVKSPSYTSLSSSHVTKIQVISTQGFILFLLPY